MSARRTNTGTSGRDRRGGGELGVPGSAWSARIENAVYVVLDRMSGSKPLRHLQLWPQGPWFEKPGAPARGSVKVP
jgi:hypothetical protein